MDAYYLTDGCGCLVPAVEGSVYCASCWDTGCDCRCPQCRTSACTGVANGCECGCCQHDRRGGRFAPASKALVKKEPEKKGEGSLGSGACSMGSSLSESVPVLRAGRCRSVLQEEIITIYTIHARDPGSSAVLVRGVSLAAELVDSLMCLWDVVRDPRH